MSILTKASQNSRCRGYEYYINGKVLSCEKINEYEYEGTVKGNMEEPYKVRINLDKTLSSDCDCPFANGKKICKHMVAVFYTVFPDEAQKYNAEYREYSKAYSKKYYYGNCHDDYDDYDDYDDDCDEDYDEFEDMLWGYIKRLSKSQLQEALFQLLYDNPEDPLEQFISDFIEGLL